MSGRGKQQQQQQQQPKIKGLVKRCRSFKEDLISRLARKGRGDSSSSSSDKTAGTTDAAPTGYHFSTPLPPSDDPLTLINHTLKEANLTLQFIESLIQKNCVDLLGGSSNVFLDLIGHLLNNVKSLTALSQGAVSGSVSEIRGCLGEFLCAVDLLLLQGPPEDEGQKELYFEKVLHTLHTTREALARLKNIVDGKENNNGHGAAARHHSTTTSGLGSSSFLTSTPTRGVGGGTSSYGSARSTSSSPFPPLSPVGQDLIEEPTPAAAAAPLPPHPPRGISPDRRPPLPPKLKQWSAKSFDSEWIPGGRISPSSSHQSLLTQWLETTVISPNSTASHPRSLSSHHHAHLKMTEEWTESSIYVSRQKISSSSTSKSRTYSDSYQLDKSSESLLLEDSRSAGANSQSISLGSSLDNLLLVDTSGGNGNSGRLSAGNLEEVFEELPALPVKQNRGALLLHNGGGRPPPRAPSPYENVVVEECGWGGARDFMSYSESRNTLVGEDPRPPLPPKKKHSLIAAYVEFLHNFESYSSSHHTHFHNHLNQIHHQHQEEMLKDCSSTASSHLFESAASAQRRQFRAERSQTLHNPGTAVSLSRTTYNLSPEDEEYPQHTGPTTTAPALPPKRGKSFGLRGGKAEEEEEEFILIVDPQHKQDVVAAAAAAAVLPPASSLPSSPGNASASRASPPLTIAEEDVFLMDAHSLLIPNEAVGRTGTNADGPGIKGGEPHLLLVYAAEPDLQVKLVWGRYQHFEKRCQDRPSLIHGRATLELFTDVVASLTPMDLDDGMVSKVKECIYHLVDSGEIQSALKARKALIQKYQIRRKLLSPKLPLVALAVSSEAQSLLQWSATCIAQQMTLLDAELFRALEPAELLLWAREQSEDLCPALNYFTEHFNKVSYWARSRVLLCITSRERNRTMKKMIQVMRKLREYNNFNSLLAVLAALDSAPIRRLGFSRRLTEALKPHAALTDSSGSFRTYRQALSESKPPCIPYM